MEKDREKTIIKTSIIGIIANILLVVAKAIIGFLAMSVSIVLNYLKHLNLLIL